MDSTQVGQNISFPAWDTDGVLVFQQLHAPLPDLLMTWVSGTWIWVPFYAFLLFNYYKWLNWKVLWLLVFIAAMVTLTDQFTSGFMKPYFLRLRPCHEPGLMSLLHLPDGCGGTYGFASSHAANTFGLAAFSWFLFGTKHRAIAWLWFWAFVVSLSRVYLGKHYPLDVMAGGVVGVFFGFCLQWAFVKLVKPVIQ
jgi:undecaprenyl-diphosphatase